VPALNVRAYGDVMEVDEDVVSTWCKYPILRFRLWKMHFSIGAGRKVCGSTRIEFGLNVAYKFDFPNP